jgi:hypothetical protein
MKKTNEDTNPSNQIELLMLLFANTQTSILLLDEVPKTKVFANGYRQLLNRMQAANVDKVKQLYASMGEFPEDQQSFEYAFGRSQEVSEQMIKCIKNNSLDTLLAMLKALNDGEIKVLPSKHNKIMKHLEPLAV